MMIIFLEVEAKTPFAVSQLVHSSKYHDNRHMDVDNVKSREVVRTLGIMFNHMDNPSIDCLPSCKKRRWDIRHRLEANEQGCF